MKWFKHDSNSNRDPKLEKILMKFGADGYALYWMCLELISEPIDKNNITFELKHDAEILAFRLKIDSHRVEEIMTYMVNLELFETNPSNQRITCLKLASRIENSIVKSPQLKEIQAELKSKCITSGLDVRDNPRQSEISQDNIGTFGLELDRDIDLEENKNLEKDYKEKNTKKEKPNYQQEFNRPVYEDYPNDQEPARKLDRLITEGINHWNSKDNLPTCIYTVLTLPYNKRPEITNKFDVFRDGQILTAIDNLSKAYGSIDQKYRPKNFQNFICNSLDNWFEEMIIETEKPILSGRTPQETRYLNHLSMKNESLDTWNDDREKSLLESKRLSDISIDKLNGVVDDRF